MTNETLLYVEAVNGREWSQDDQSRKDFDYLVRSLPIDLDRDLLEPFDFLKEFTLPDCLLNDPTDWMGQFGSWLDHEFPATPIIDVAY